MISQAKQSREATKRSREATPSVDDIVYYGRVVMGNDPYKELAPKEDERIFRALFGCGATVALALWKMLCDNDLVPASGKIIHLLWTLLFMKQYPTEKTFSTMCGGVHGNTLRKYVHPMINAICLLEANVVSTPDQQCVCFHIVLLFLSYASLVVTDYLGEQVQR